MKCQQTNVEEMIEGKENHHLITKTHQWMLDLVGKRWKEWNANLIGKYQINQVEGPAKLLPCDLKSIPSEELGNSSKSKEPKQI